MRLTCILFLYLTLAYINTGRAQFQCDPRLMQDSAEIIFDGPVNKFITNDHFLYAGGDFQTVGKYSGSFIEIDRNTGEARERPTWPKSDGRAAAIRDGGNTLIVFGTFTKVGDSVRKSIARIDLVGKYPPAFNVTVNGDVNAAVVINGKLYIGGNFTTVNGVSRNRLAAIDIATGVLTPWNPNVINIGPLPCRVECMIAYNGFVYVGGAFSKIGVAARKNIAAVDTLTAAVSSWGPDAYFSTAPTYGNVSKMLRVGNQLFICGGFDVVAGQPHADIAGINLFTGLSTSWTPNPNSVVLSLASKGDTLYVGGAFYQISGQPRQGVAAYSINTGTLLPVIVDTKKKFDLVYDLMVLGDTLFIGGKFDSINNQCRQNMAAVNKFTGAVLPFECHTNGTVYSFLWELGHLYAGGEFFSVHRKRRPYLAALDMDADTAISWNPKVDDVVRNIDIINNSMYISGDFTKLNDSARPYNGAIYMPTGKVTTWNPNANNYIKAIQRYKNDIYIGGDFTNVNGQAVKCLAKVDTLGTPQSFTAITDTGTAPKTVNCLAIYNDSLYIGGQFNFLQGQLRRSFGAINLKNGSLIPWNPAFYYSNKLKVYREGFETVTTFWLSGNLLYTGGFYGVATVQTLPIAPKPLTPPYADTDTVVTYKNFISPYKLTHSDNTKATMVAPQPDLLFDDPVYVIADDITVGGAFGTVNNHVQKTICIPDFTPPPNNKPFWLTTFNPNIPGGVVRTICYYGNKLFIGGDLLERKRGYQGAAMFYVPGYSGGLSNLVTDTNSICDGVSITARVTGAPSYGAVYQWYVNGARLNNPLPYYKFTPENKDTLSCVVSTNGNGCTPTTVDNHNVIVFNVIPRIMPHIKLLGPKEAIPGSTVIVKAIVLDAFIGWSIEWFNKGNKIGTTMVDSFTYTKGPGTDSIYAVITPRPDTCYITDTSGKIGIEEEVVVGIKHTSGDASIKVYPNPFDSYVQISGLKAGDILLLYDVTGRKISVNIAAQLQYVLTTGDLKTGVYVLKITDKEGVLRKSMLIEKR